MAYKRRQAVASPPGGGAPAGAQFITSSADPTLTSERVLTDTATVTWDFTTPGQAKATAAAAAPQNTFLNIAVATQPTIVADTSTDTLTVVAGPNITITTNAITDTLTIEAAAAAAQNTFTTIAVAGQSNVVADTPTDTVTYVAGTNMTITTNAATDEVTFTAAGGGAATDASQQTFMVRMGGDRTLVNNIITKIIFDVENFDTAGVFDPVTNYRHTPTKAGKYLYSCTITGQTGATGTFWRILPYKNAVLIQATKRTPLVSVASAVATTASVIVEMNGTTDFVEFFTHHESVDGLSKLLYRDDPNTGSANATIAYGVFISV